VFNIFSFSKLFPSNSLLISLDFCCNADFLEGFLISSPLLILFFETRPYFIKNKIN